MDRNQCNNIFGALEECGWKWVNDLRVPHVTHPKKDLRIYYKQSKYLICQGMGNLGLDYARRPINLDHCVGLGAEAIEEKILENLQRR